MTSVHFDPYFVEDEENDKTMCGVKYPYEEAEATTNWDHVTCKRCLRQKGRLVKSVSRTESHILQQMGEMTEFFEKELK